MSDDFDPTSTRDELERLTGQKAALLNHFRFAVEADLDLTDEEKAEAIGAAEDGLDNAFFRSINSLESDLEWHDGHVSAMQRSADVADYRART